MSAPPALSRRKFRRRAEARPDEVLDAALDLFIRFGFAATRVEDIARRAGLSKGAVYLYYPSKQAIMQALIERAVVPIAARAEELGRNEGDDPRRTLAAIVRMLGGGVADPRIAAIPKIIIGEAGNFPELAESYRRKVIERGLGALTAVLRRGVETGHFRALDPELAVRNVVGPLLAHLLLAQVFGLRPAGDPATAGDGGAEDDEGAAMSRFLDSHLDILLNGLLATAPDGSDDRPDDASGGRPR